MSDSTEKHPVLRLSQFGAVDPCQQIFSSSSAKPAGAVQTHIDRDHEEDEMGKYFLAWLLGIPAVVLVLIYFFMN